MKRLNSKQRNYVIVGLCMILVIMGIGYAAFTSQLKISGTSKIATEWNVKITDIQSKNISGQAKDVSAPTYTDTTATFSTSLTSPGDAMQYDITVSNEGNIDAILNDIQINDSNNPAIIFETSGIENGDKLEANQTDILTVIVSYNSSVTSQPENTESTITVTLNYKQDDGMVNPPEPSNQTIIIGGQPVDVVTSGDGLYEDTYEEGRYIYKGKNVNNYITFNNEVWRIVSIEPDKTIKIMREANLGDRAWDSSSSYGKNNWARPADLNTYLNGSYLTGTLNATAQSQIVPKDWSIGAVTENNNDLADQINDEKSTTWNGKVALVTVSEYLRSNSNQSSCGTFSKINDNYSTCQNSSWMYINDTWWTLSPDAGGSNGVFPVRSYGHVNFDSAFISSNAVRPAVYLSSEVKITGGDGSQSNPYVLN